MSTNTATDYTEIAGLKVATPLYKLVSDKITPGTGIDPDKLWQSFAGIVNDLTPVNESLLAQRIALQKQIDQWHREHKGQPHDPAAYKKFLCDIGYLVEGSLNTIIVNHHAVKNVRICFACTNLDELIFQVIDGFIHFFPGFLRQ